jgi:hypothetical protein
MFLTFCENKHITILFLSKMTTWSIIRVILMAAKLDIATARQICLYVNVIYRAIVAAN